MSREIEERARCGDATVVLIEVAAGRDTDNIETSSWVVERTGVVGLFVCGSARFADRCSAWSGDRHRLPGVLGATGLDEEGTGGRGFIRGGVGGLTMNPFSSSSSPLPSES